MFSLEKTYFVLGYLLWLCVGTNSQDSNYFFPDQQSRFLQNYQTQNDFGNQQDVSHFRPSETFRPIDPFFQSDLQTSDLPPHLQQTLPQYRFSGLPLTTKEPSGFKLPNYQQNSNRNVVPSTHRPNYSHLFSKNHDPRTETFLGQITLDSPAELPPEFSRFRPVLDFQKTNTPPPPASEWSASKPRYLNTQDNVNQNLDYTEKPRLNAVSFSKPTRSSFLNHRTRIFAPSSDEEYKKPLVKDYFITNDGDVLATSDKPKTTTSGTAELPFESIRITRPQTTTESNLESLLEEPINSKESSKHGKQDVEVIQSITVPPDQLYTLPEEDYDEDEEEDEEEEFTTEEYDYEIDTNESHENQSDTNQTTANDIYHNHSDGEYIHKINSTDIKSNVSNANEVTTNANIPFKPLTTTELNKLTGNPVTEEEQDYLPYEEYEETEDSTEEINNKDVQSTPKSSTSHHNPEMIPTLEVTTMKNQENTTKDNDTKLSEGINTELIKEIAQKSEEEPISDAHEEISAEDNNLHEDEEEDEDAEYEDDGGKEDLNEIPDPKSGDINDKNNNKTYEIITMKPITGNKSENFKDFTDTESIDATDPTLLTTNSNEETKLDKSKVSPKTNESVVSVSVVTTKSVINNTVIGTVTPLPMTTQQMIVQSENSTDSWIVIASVQTSRSISGARYIPSGIIEQQERKAFLGGKDRTLIETSEEEITTVKSSTESLIDKLDRVQSDLSSKYLPSQFKNDDNNYIISNGKEDMLVVETTTPSTTTTTTLRTTTLPPVKIRKFSPAARPTTSKPKRPYHIKPFHRIESHLDVPQGDQPFQHNGTTGRSSGLPSKTKITVQDVSSFLPAGYKPSKDENQSNSNLLEELLNKVNVQDPTALLPPGYKGSDSSLLPPGYKIGENNITSTSTTLTTTSTTERISTTTVPKKAKGDLFKSTVPVDLSHFVPKEHKLNQSKETMKNKSNNILETSLPEDISKFLPPGYSSKTTLKPRVVNSPEGSKNKTKDISSLFEDAKSDDLSKFLPPDYNKFKFAGRKPTTTTSTTTTSTTTEATSTTPTTQTSNVSSTASNSPPSNSFKVVFPSRPGQNRKMIRSTTPKPTVAEFTPPTAPSIQKGWPSRATTEFTGWPTPSTTPISIEKLLAAAKDMTSSTTTEATSTTISTTTTTTTTTTTVKPTTPGICDDDCELGGTIKLVGGAKWVPELLDRNTKEWQILANEVQSQLERVYSKSNVLNKWYRKIRIDSFSEGSVLVDYVVVLNDIGREINTQELKKIFHDSLDDGLKASNREPKSTDLDDKEKDDRLTLGDFIVDPKYTDFVVLPPIVVPTVGYAEDDVLLPQWAIAVIVIGLASLLFVIIFGVTVLVNRQKNNKKKQPIPLTEDMINELNKNHMGGIDNYGADDLYNMEDVWNDRPYDIKPKKRSSGSIHDNSMSNLYDSWRSEWNGYYYNAYYANNPGSSRRRSDYDTNF